MSKTKGPSVYTIMFIVGIWVFNIGAWLLSGQAGPHPSEPGIEGFMIMLGLDLIFTAIILFASSHSEDFDS